jgi:hypothetical protein
MRGHALDVQHRAGKARYDHLGSLPSGVPRRTKSLASRRSATPHPICRRKLDCARRSQAQRPVLIVPTALWAHTVFDVLAWSASGLTGVALARARPIRHLMVNTNGIRIAPGAGVRRAAGHVTAALRGLPAVRLAGRRGADGSARRPAAGVRRRALEALEAAGISTTLVVTVK